MNIREKYLARPNELYDHYVVQGFWRSMAPARMVEILTDIKPYISTHQADRADILINAIKTKLNGNDKSKTDNRRGKDSQGI